MNEKRFELSNMGNIQDNVKNDFLSVGEVVDLLNKLYEENEQLKVLLKDSEDQVETLKESNKKLIESLVQKESED